MGAILQGKAVPKREFWRKITKNWERIVFSIVGLVLISYGFRFIYNDEITGASIVFALGFFSFLYANISRFKRFKGFGIEGELWEDKQKEAADLIERLRAVVSIYTREIILGRVKAGRMIDGPSWEDSWQLYDDLVTQHDSLGQKIDFTDVKKELDDYFLFDMTMPEIGKLQQAVRDGKNIAREKIKEEFGNPIKDIEGYNTSQKELNNIGEGISDPFTNSVNGDLAGIALNFWKDAKERLKSDFDVDIEIDPDVLAKLQKISSLYQKRPVQVNAELIVWANRK